MKTLKVLGVFASTLSSVLAMEYNDENKQPTDTNFTQYEDTAVTPPGVISGSGQIVKEMPGCITLSGPNTYTDSIIIDVRTLSISASKNYYNGQLVISGETLKVEEHTASGLNDTLDVEAQHN